MDQQQATLGAAPPAEKTSLVALAGDRRAYAMLGLGFASGLPLLLVYVTQQAWLYDAKVPYGIIGLMSEVTLAYKLKFLWAPFLERHDAPLFGRLLGRRRGWIVVAQIMVVLALTGVAFGDPAHWLAWQVAFSMALGFAGSTQDVVVDGWRIAAASKEEQAALSSIAEIGWRVGNLAGGAGALILAQHYGWRAAYLAMAALMVPGLLAALLAPEPARDAAHEPAPASLGGTILTPIKEIWTRLGPLALPILVMVAGFRMPGYVSGVMEVPLFKSLGYSNTDIATVTKVFGFWVAIGGTSLSGLIVPRIGIMASLVFGTIFGSASHLALAYLAAHGGKGTGEFWLFATTVSIDNFAYAFASVVLITYMSTIVAREHAASQFALLTSLCALPGSLVALSAGFVVERIGFTNFFVATSLIGLPVAALTWWVWHVKDRAEPAAAQTA